MANLKLEKWIKEKKYRREGKKMAIMLAIVNILMLLTLQNLQIDIPILLKVNILLILAGILFLEIRPWR